MHPGSIGELYTPSDFALNSNCLPAQNHTHPRINTPFVYLGPNIFFSMLSAKTPAEITIAKASVQNDHLKLAST